MVNFALVASGASASLAGSVTTNAGTLNGAIDGDDTTPWQGKATGSLWAYKVDLGQARAINSFRVTCDAIPGSVTVQSSTDNVNFTVRGSVLFPGDTGWTGLASTVTARYWQFLVNNAAVNSILTLWTWELRDDAGNPWPVFPGTNVATQGATAAQLDQRFTSWLDEGSTDHPTGRLVQIETKIDAIKSEEDTLTTRVGTPTDASTGATVFGKLAAQQAEIGTPTDASTALTLFGKLAGLASTPPTGLAGAVTTLAADITTAVSSIVGTAGRTISDVSHDVASVENHLLDVVSGRAGFPTGTPNTAWVLAATTDFDTELAWAQPADMYLVSITAVRAGQSQSTFAGLTWYYRLGTWCELNGSLGSHRRFLEFEHQMLENAGRRMAGLALRCQPGTIGTVQAWTLG